MSDSEFGRFTGRLIFEPLRDGRRMRVVEEFGFLESDGLHWPVPPSSVVDGASIPQPLWPLIGGPFEGKYRDGSVVHDYYCAVRSAEWKAVHRMFYRAMRASGVSERLAKIMYAAVYFAGPRWDDMVIENVRLGAPAVPTRDHLMFSVNTDPLALAVSELVEQDGMTAYRWALEANQPAPSQSGINLHLDLLSELVEREDPSLKNLERALDRAVEAIPNGSEVTREISVGELASLG